MQRPNKTHQFRSVLAVLFVCGFSASSQAADMAVVTKARNTIQSKDLKRHVNVLASDTLEGREAGERGGRAAGLYLKKYLVDHKIAGRAGRGRYLQEFGYGYRNLLAIIPGSDPKLKDEYVMVGAHYDHVGYGSETTSLGRIGFIHNGADDNASGVAGLLEVVQAFSELDAKPKRSLVVVFWDGEEKGLLGSNYWIQNPTFQLNKIKLYCNVDMIGRMVNNRLTIFGTRSGFGLRQLAAKQNSDPKLNLHFTWQVRKNSDHWPFYERRIPFLMLHTGEHADYHRPTDDVDKLNMTGMQQSSRFLFQLLHAALDAEQLSGFRTACYQENEQSREEFERPVEDLPPRLGLQWDRMLEDKSGVVQVTTVLAQSAADRAGFQPEDRILKFGSTTIEKGTNFLSLVLSSPQSVEVLAKRASRKEPQTLKVQLDGEPVRLGISWRPDTADKKCVCLIRVSTGSPADIAGLKVNDRVYRIAGKPFSSSEEFLKLAITEPSPLTFEVDRKGHLQEFTLKVPRPLQKQSN